MKSTEEIKRLEEISKNFYDTIDFRQYIPERGEMPLRELMSQLEDYYDNHHPELLPEELEGYIFDVIDEEDFFQYLKERYGLMCRLEIVENYYIRRSY